MTDLIWIGNTLYPRWTIFAAVALLWLIIGVVVANYTWPRWWGLPFWWVSLLWPALLKRSLWK